MIDKCLSRLVALTQSNEHQLVYHAAWAFKNLTHNYNLSSEDRMQILRKFPWPHVRALMHHPDNSVQASALTFIQNVCSSDRDSIENVMEWSQPELLDVISEKLSHLEECSPPVVAASLRVVSNISTGNAGQQAAVMDSGIPAQLLQCLRDDRCEHIRCAAAWCVINLIWRDELPLANECGDEARARAATLRALGIEAELKTMQGDASLDVRERVRTALGFFSV